MCPSVVLIAGECLSMHAQSTQAKKKKQFEKNAIVRKELQEGREGVIMIIIVVDCMLAFRQTDSYKHRH